MPQPGEFILDPNAVLDFQFDWKPYTHGRTGAASDWLATGETISTKTITASAGITVDSSSISDGTVTVWLSGGTLGTRPTVACKITTNQSRTDERTITLIVENR